MPTDQGPVMDEGSMMAAVALDDGGWIAVLVLGVLAAYAGLRHFFPPETK
jgi:hypothetical protein